MFCDLKLKDVLVKDCEECITKRKCKTECLTFVWGMNDYAEPVFGGEEEFVQEIEKDVKEKTFIKKYIPNKLRWIVFNRDNFVCKNCQSSFDLTVDHIVPESKGGETVLGNLQTLCRECNCKKSNKLEE